MGKWKDLGIMNVVNHRKGIRRRLFSFFDVEKTDDICPECGIGNLVYYKKSC